MKKLASKEEEREAEFKKILAAVHRKATWINKTAIPIPARISKKRMKSND